jgi:hypothetical protein
MNKTRRIWALGLTVILVILYFGSHRRRFPRGYLSKQNSIVNPTSRPAIQAFLQS